MIKVLFIGDIIGKPGRNAVKELLPSVKNEYQINLTIANGENSAGGFGIVPSVINELLNSGIDVITTGNHVWDKKELLPVIEQNPRLLRPINFPEGVPGKGAIVLSVNGYQKVAVINALGRVYLPALDCPFRRVLREVDKLETKIIIVDFHAEVTSEKQAFGWFLDGKVSAIIGTHTHVQTADEKILPEGTAYITDVGMTGPHDSVIGIKKEQALKRFLLQMPEKFDVATDDIRFSAICIEIDEKTAKAVNIIRIHKKI